MRSVLRLNAFAIVCCFFLISCRSRERPGRPRVLLFTQAAGLRPASFSAGLKAIRKLGDENLFETDTSSDPSRFTEDSLRQYAAVIFLGVARDLLNNYQEADFERYIQAGGGFSDIPAAGINGDEHALTRHFHPEGSRVWHEKAAFTEASWSDATYLKDILAGIQQAIGKNEVLDYSQAGTLRVPEENRFTKTMLVEGQFFEPTEMTILPDLDVLIAQRRGELLLYKHDSRQLKRAGFLPVYYKALTPTGSTEEGLLGIQADPDFASNHFIYLYYSPTDTPVDRLSRFSFTKDSLDPASEKIILQVHERREICCHTGGSIAFGKDHDLFLSTGDNSTPFDEPGKPPFNLHSFAPLDDRPGHQPYDSRRGAGNSNDLRGKIIRIKIHPDGSYSIPEGNLFPTGTAKTRAEIYVMGDRNPYRISVDKKNGFLYWGEVGPDAANDSLATRGPRGYDEINQARKAGNFGWPYFVGNNYPYHEYDFNSGRTGIAFDPQKPVNNSRNNTGLRLLPPAQPAFIWYPYAESKDFPGVGTGGRTAMAGPVYHTDLFPDSSRYPDYYNNKLFIYDWIRGWIKVVTMLPNGDFNKMEPFM
jgi:glucose/arabinose dehydrogenase